MKLMLAGHQPDRFPEDSVSLMDSDELAEMEKMNELNETFGPTPGDGSIASGSRGLPDEMNVVTLPTQRRVENTSRLEELMTPSSVGTRGLISPAEGEEVKASQRGSMDSRLSTSIQKNPETEKKYNRAFKLSMAHK